MDAGSQRVLVVWRSTLFTLRRKWLWGATWLATPEVSVAPKDKRHARSHLSHSPETLQLCAFHSNGFSREAHAQKATSPLLASTNPLSYIPQVHLTRSECRLTFHTLPMQRGLLSQRQHGDTNLTRSSPLKPDELQVLRAQFEKEGDYVGVQTKFNYAWVCACSRNVGGRI